MAVDEHLWMAASVFIKSESLKQAYHKELPGAYSEHYQTHKMERSHPELFTQNAPS